MYLERTSLELTAKLQDGIATTVEFSAWDFACGTELLAKFFIEPRSIFIVTFDLRDIAKEKIRSWLRLISTRAGTFAPILLVGTHADEKLFKEEGAMATTLNTLAQDLTCNFPGVKLITAVSSYDGTGIEELRNSLITEALNQKQVGKIIPKPYALLEESIKSIAEEKKALQQPPIIPWSELVPIAAKSHIHTESTLRSATAFLKDLGVLVTFSDENFGFLAPTIVIDPPWICELVVRLIQSLNHSPKFYYRQQYQELSIRMAL